ncbi:hypothetical protein, partial [Bradyrhizobium sp. Gha]|uniref:hypothetical protein n=1 Tax=Bradyrhizobium sp. Gha TaxID=1855318 RepID=UPI001AECD32F
GLDHRDQRPEHADIETDEVHAASMSPRIYASSMLAHLRGPTWGAPRSRSVAGILNIDISRSGAHERRPTKPSEHKTHAPESARDRRRRAFDESLSIARVPSAAALCWATNKPEAAIFESE